MKNLTMFTKSLAVLCGTALVGSPMAADNTRSPGVNARQRAQQERIKEGARSGQLTQEETRKLEGEERTLRTEERAYKADGKLTPAERRDLHQDANQISRDIHRERHDRDLRARPPRPRPQDPLVNARQHTQQGRVAQGVRSGELTKSEATQLRQEEQAIRTEERAYKADGKLTAAERKDLHQDLQQSSKDIYQQKHDAESRVKAAPPPAPPTAK